MIKQGDIFQLGQHRLMCGDATDINDVNKLIGGDKIDLVLTDPPYGMKCQDKNGVIGDAKTVRCARKEFGLHGGSGELRAKKYPIMINDNNQNIAKKHYNIIKNISDKQIIWGAQYFANFLPVSGAWIFWDKKTPPNDFSDGELAWVSKGKRVRKYEHRWNGILRDGNYMLNPKPRVHPTQKPVELHMRILEDFSKEGDVILDCFGGSGTTLIACEQVNRKCLMMEISPEYCEIIINRWEKLSPLTNKAHELGTCIA